MTKLVSNFLLEFAFKIDKEKIDILKNCYLNVALKVFRLLGLSKHIFRRNQSNFRVKL